MMGRVKQYNAAAGSRVGYMGVLLKVRALFWEGLPGIVREFNGYLIA